VVLGGSQQLFGQQPLALSQHPLAISSPDSLTTGAAQRGPAWVQGSEKRPLLVSSLLISAGALTMAKMHLVETDDELHEEIREHMARPTTTLDNQLRYLPGVVTVGLGLAGVKGRHTPVDKVLLGALTYTINDAVTSHLKKLTHVLRPDGSNFHSFPSQHTSTAFAAATFLQKEYGGRSVWYSVGGYSVAAATGSLRMVKDAHCFPMCWPEPALVSSPPKRLTGSIPACSALCANWWATRPWYCPATNGGLPASRPWWCCSSRHQSPIKSKPESVHGLLFPSSTVEGRISLV
jgi:hypothetical protein